MTPEDLDAKLRDLDKQWQAKGPAYWNPAAHFIIALPDPKSTDPALQHGGPPIWRDAIELEKIISDAHEAGVFTGRLAVFGDAIDTAGDRGYRMMLGVFRLLKSRGWDCFGVHPENPLRIMGRAFIALAHEPDQDQAKPGSVTAPAQPAASVDRTGWLTLTEAAQKAVDAGVVHDVNKVRALRKAKSLICLACSRPKQSPALRSEGQYKDRRIEPISLDRWIQAQIDHAKANADRWTKRDEVKVTPTSKAAPPSTDGPTNRFKFCTKCNRQVRVVIINGIEECPDCHGNDLSQPGAAQQLQKSVTGLRPKPAKIGNR
jgi:hypothetical protein